MQQAFARIAERLEQAPGAAAAGLVSTAPFEGGSDNGLIPEGRPLDIRSAIQSDFRLVTPGYFRTMGIRLRRGRHLHRRRPRRRAAGDGRQRDAGPRRHGPARTRSASGSPAARRARTAIPEWKTVVGVVADVRARGLGQGLRPEFYLPMHPDARRGVALDRPHDDARAPRRPAIRPPSRRAIRDAVWSVDRSLPVYDVGTMDDLRFESHRGHPVQHDAAHRVRRPRAAARGGRGLRRHLVRRDAADAGDRHPRRAGRGRPDGCSGWSWVMRRRSPAPGSCSASRARSVSRSVIAGLLFQVSPTDPPTLAAGVVLLSFVALLAAVIPARRAARVDPAVALRAE